MPGIVSETIKFIYRCGLDWIFEQPWPDAIFLSFLLLLLGTCLWLLKFRILKRLVALVRKTESWRAQPIPVIQTLVRVFVGICFALFTVGFAWTAATRYYQDYLVKSVAEKLTRSQKAMLVSAYTCHQFKSGDIKKSIMNDQLKPINESPAELSLMLLVHSRETLVELGLMVESPYFYGAPSALKLPSNIINRKISFEPGLTSLGIKVGSYLFDKYPGLIPKNESTE